MFSLFQTGSYGHSQGENHELVLIQIIELLLANGADVNPMYGLGKETPLDYVKETPLAFKSDESIEHILRKHGGFTIRELYSVTEHIMDAASIGHYGAVRQHLASGVSANWRGKWSDSRGGLSGSNLTPLYAAAINGHKKVAELLINNGAKVNAKNFSDASPLYAAAKDGHKEVAELLIAKGADVNVKTSDGYSLLYVATSGNYWNRNEKEIVELLIANGADVNAKAKDGGTPLHNAASSGGFSYDSTAPGYGTAKEIVELLIAKGANVNRRDNDGMTPLHIACGGSGNKEIAKLLIEKGADINAKSVGSNKSFYETPLDVPLSLDQDFWQTKDLFDLRNLLRKHGGKTSKELKAEGK